MRWGILSREGPRSDAWNFRNFLESNMVGEGGEVPLLRYFEEWRTHVAASGICDGFLAVLRPLDVFGL